MDWSCCSTWGKIRSIATDNELFHKWKINQLFEDNDIEHYVEDSGIHSKLGVINRFHRTLRLLLDKFMLYLNTNRWIDIIGYVIHNYNHRIHRILGQEQNDMTHRDVSKWNKKYFL